MVWSCFFSECKLSVHTINNSFLIRSGILYEFYTLEGEIKIEAGQILIERTITRAVRSFDFEITSMISDQIALHSVQLPLFIRRMSFDLLFLILAATITPSIVLVRIVVKLCFFFSLSSFHNFFS